MAASPSKTNATATSQSPDFERVKATLSPFRAMSLGIGGGFHTGSHRVITNIEEVEDPEELKRSFPFKQLEDEDCKWYKLTRVPESDGQDCKDSVSEELWRAAIMQMTCQKVMYCLIQKVRKVMKDYPGFEKVRWRRQPIRPALMMIYSDRDPEKEIPICYHDMMYIDFEDKTKFVLDLTSDQFGIDEWFFTAKEYYQAHVWHAVQNPPIVSEAKLIDGLEGEDERLPAFKVAVEKAIAAEEEQWAASNGKWSDIHTLSKSAREDLLESMTRRVKQAVVDFLETEN